MTEDAEEVKKIEEVELKEFSAKGHDITLALDKAISAEIGAGTDIALKVRVSCSSACDLRGKNVKIIAQRGVPKEMEIELTEFDGEVNETDEFDVRAPTKPEEYTWTVIFQQQESEGILHKENLLPFFFVIKPHVTSISVWDVPFPLVSNTKCRIKVGLKCSDNCKLAGSNIEINDHESNKVATGILGNVPWLGTGALYWTEVELKVPDTNGDFIWEANYPKPDLKLPHEGASCTFALHTISQPEHRAIIEVIDKDTKNPIEGAYILMPPYRSKTDKDGIAKLEVLGGEYKIYISKREYKKFETTVSVGGNVAIKAELLVAPPISFSL